MDTDISHAVEARLAAIEERLDVLESAGRASTKPGYDEEDTEVGQLPANGEDAPTFQPSSHTVEEVLTYAQENPDEVPELLEQERTGKNRSTLVAQLEEY